MNIFTETYYGLRAINFAYIRRRHLVAPVEESGDMGHSTEYDKDGNNDQSIFPNFVAVGREVTRTEIYRADSNGRVLPDKSYITGSRIDVSG